MQGNIEYPEIGRIVFDNRLKGVNFPTEEKLCQDVVSILRQKDALHPAIVKQVLDGALWWMADYTGKGLKCQLRSRSADKECKKIDEEGGRSVKGRGFVHDHIKPKNVIRKELMDLNENEASYATVLPLLRQSIYCLVLEKEDKDFLCLNRARMPPNCLREDFWARYRGEYTKDTGIQVVLVQPGLQKQDK